MSTILVPTDFSPTAANATRYAIRLAEQLHTTKIILYHAYQVPVSTDPTLPTLQLFSLEDIRSASMQGLQRFREEMAVYETGGAVIETLSEFNVLAEGMKELTERLGVSLVVMGITGGDKMEEVLIGSNTIGVARHSPVPVIIVPAEAVYRPVEKVVLACDFKKIEETTPVNSIRQLLQQTGARLLVLNIGNEKEPPLTAAAAETRLLENLLHDLHPEFHFLQSADFAGAINQFAVAQQVDLILAIPKKHGWFDGLFHRSHTKMLAFHSHVPIMVVHE